MYLYVSGDLDPLGLFGIASIERVVISGTVQPEYQSATGLGLGIGIRWLRRVPFSILSRFESSEEYHKYHNLRFGTPAPARHRNVTRKITNWIKNIADEYAPTRIDFGDPCVRFAGFERVISGNFLIERPAVLKTALGEVHGLKARVRSMRVCVDCRGNKVVTLSAQFTVWDTIDWRSFGEFKGAWQPWLSLWGAFNNIGLSGEAILGDFLGDKVFQAWYNLDMVWRERITVTLSDDDEVATEVTVTP